MAIILVSAQEAGAANALVPVIDWLKTNTPARVTILAQAEAVRVLAQAGLSSDIEPEALSDDALEHAVRGIGPSACLLGTAWGDSIDKRVLRLAEADRIPSVSVIDMWSYYRERFTDPCSNKLRCPTKIAVMDERSRDQAAADGLPRAILTVTGQPYLEAFSRALRQPELRREADALRRRWSGDATIRTRIVLFLSEALSRDFGLSTSYYRGYTERDALHGLRQALLKVGRSPGGSSTLVVKLHPLERQHTMAIDPLSEHETLRVETEAPIWPCLLAADAVVGMTSMALVESLIAGRPTISFQPGLTDRGRSAIGPWLGGLPTVSTVDALESWLGRTLMDPAVPMDERVTGPITEMGTTHAGAAERIGRLVMELAHRTAEEPAASRRA